MYTVMTERKLAFVEIFGMGVTEIERSLWLYDCK